MTPNEETERALAKDQPWQAAYAYVEQQAKAVLDTAGIRTFSTRELVGLLYSNEGSWQEQTQKRLFQALDRLSEKHKDKPAPMAGYVTIMERQKIGKKGGFMGRPRVWHAPKPVQEPERCYACGQVMP